MNEGCGVNRNSAFFADFSCCFDVVSMVVSDEYAFHLTDLHAVFHHALLETSKTNATVDDDGFCACSQIIAVATTSASETEKGELAFAFFFLARDGMSDFVFHSCYVHRLHEILFFRQID